MKSNRVRVSYLILFYIFDINLKSPSFFEKSLYKGGRLYFLPGIKCGITKEECPP
jgi:hypothetical protein